MTAVPRAGKCEDAIACASLELDGELSHLGRVRLAAHLRGCVSCAATVAEMRAVTTRLRAAPLEHPEQPAFVPGERSAAFPPRSLGVRVAVAVALAALAAGFGILVGALREDASAPPPQPAPEIALLRPEDEIDELRRERRREFRRPTSFSGV